MPGGMPGFLQKPPFLFPPRSPNPFGLGFPPSMGMMPMYPGFMPLVRPIRPVPTKIICLTPECLRQGPPKRILKLCGGKLYFIPPGVLATLPFCAILISNGASTGSDGHGNSSIPHYQDVTKRPGPEQQPGIGDHPGPEQQPGNGQHPETEDHPGPEQYPGPGQHPEVGDHQGFEQQPEVGDHPGPGSHPEPGAHPGSGGHPGLGEASGPGEYQGYTQHPGFLPGGQLSTSFYDNGKSTISGMQGFTPPPFTGPDPEVMVGTTHKFRPPEGEDYPQQSCLEGEFWNLDAHECVPIKYDPDIDFDYTHLPGSPWSGVTRKPFNKHRLRKKKKKLVLISDKGNITYIKAT
ncbi:calcium-binding protein P-like [Venturia canescens]|uniref:calcium-binding protein P-like n=1 Tax=Venturia canescens TaxID=32260 RepID=UPI001C9C3425|nr:calcium-binding protein P-like [Venturia canescens]